MNTQKQPSCEERIDKELQGAIEDLTKLWTAYLEGDEDRHSDELGNIFEYGLSFDYVAPDTFNDQEQGYFRYQLSWGGPSDEFRFYVNPDLSVYCIEYWFLDWFDGASRELTGDDRSLLKEIYGWFYDCGSVEAELERSEE